MTQVAKKVVIDRTAKTLTIDGEQFPWHIAQDMKIVVPVAEQGIYGLEVKIWAEEVVINE